MAWCLFKLGHKLALILVEHFRHSLSDILGRQQNCNLDFLQQETTEHAGWSPAKNLDLRSGCVLVSLCVLMSFVVTRSVMRSAAVLCQRVLMTY